MNHSPSQTATVDRNTFELFASFRLDGLELALPVDTLQEVTAFREDVTRVPLAPDYVVGLCMQRGTMIPVLDLRRYFGLPDSGIVSEKRLAVIESSHARLGICFDATGEMLRVARATIVPYGRQDDFLNVMEGAFHQGERIIQVLSPDALICLPGIPQAGSRHLALPASDGLRTERRRKAISFHAGGRAMALPMEAIHEIVRMQALERSVLADGICHGWLDLRGRPVPVLDIAGFLGLNRHAIAPDDMTDSEDMRRIIVLQMDALYLGLCVDDIHSVVSYTDAQLLPTPSFPGQNGIITSYVNRREDGEADLILLGIAALFAEPYMANIARGHRNLYLVSHEAESVTEARGMGTRDTWLAFRLNRLMAVRIEQVRRVIDVPAILVRPPGAAPYVMGVINVDNDLITVFDLRHYYGLEPLQDGSESNVVVVRCGGHDYGLLVDALYGIIGVAPSEKMTVPSLVAMKMHTEMRKDVREVADSTEHGSVLLLDTSSLLQRIMGSPVETESRDPLANQRTVTTSPE